MTLGINFNKSTTTNQSTTRVDAHGNAHGKIKYERRSTQPTFLKDRSSAGLLYVAGHSLVLSGAHSLWRSFFLYDQPSRSRGCLELVRLAGHTRLGVPLGVSLHQRLVHGGPLLPDQHQIKVIIAAGPTMLRNH